MERHHNGIQWTLTTRLEDLDFADVVTLLLHKHQDMQSKLTQLGMISAKAGLRINKLKTKRMRINTGLTPQMQIG